MRIGHGYDVHALVPDRKLIRCGLLSQAAVEHRGTAQKKKQYQKKNEKCFFPVHSASLAD